MWLENRRVFDLLRSIEAKALRIRSRPEPAVAMELDDLGVTVNLPMERPLFRRSRRHSDSRPNRWSMGTMTSTSSAMLSQLYVDRDMLVQRVIQLARK